MSVTSTGIGTGICTRLPCTHDCLGWITSNSASSDANLIPIYFSGYTYDDTITPYLHFSQMNMKFNENIMLI